MDAKQGYKEGDIDLEMATMLDNRNRLDVQEAVEGDDELTRNRWTGRRRRMQALITAPAIDAASATTAAAPIDLASPRLYKEMEHLMRIVIDEDDPDRFIDVLEECFREQGLSPATIFRWVSPSNSSMLHVAAGSRKGKGNILRLIMDYFPEELLATQNARGDTALHVAARAGRADAAEILTHRSSKLYNNGHLMMMRIQNKLGDTALHDAVLRGHYDMVSWLLSKDSELMYQSNIQRKSPLYLAVEKGDSKMISVLLNSCATIEPWRMQGESPAYAAIAYNKLDVLRKMPQESLKLLLEAKDAADSNPLHLAAYKNNICAIEILLGSFPSLAWKEDTAGNLPIHVACKMGHVDTIRKLLGLLPDPTQFINQQGQNILHILAKYGRTKALRFILRESRPEVLINEKDYAGNTPLHLAAKYSQPATLVSLARDPRIELNLLNNECLAAFDIAKQRLRARFTSRRWLVAAIFVSVILPSDSPTSEDLSICKRDGRDGMPGSKLRGRINKAVETRLIVATLVAGVAFAAGFAVSADKDANLLNKRMFQAFAICNALAMYSSMFVVVLHLWGQLGSVWEKLSAYTCSTVPLATALITMTVAYMAGVSLAVSKLAWLSATIFHMGLFFVILITMAYVVMYITVVPSRLLPLRIMNFIIVDILVALMGNATPLQDIEELDTEESSSASATSDKHSTRKTKRRTGRACLVGNPSLHRAVQRNGRNI